MGEEMVEREDINASVEMGLAQLMLELHAHGDETLEIKAILTQILQRLAAIEAKLEQRKE